LNFDQGETLLDFVRFFQEREVFEATMIGVDCDGFDLCADGSLLRFDFSAPATTTGIVRATLDDLARRARRSG